MGYVDIFSPNGEGDYVQNIFMCTRISPRLVEPFAFNLSRISVEREKENLNLNLEICPSNT